MLEAWMLGLLAYPLLPGVAEGRCRPHEPGPAILVEAAGLKDRTGTLRLELYPSRKSDFLADDTVLIAAGKTFRRVTLPAPKDGAILICIRAPSAGRYALALTHNRGGRSKFDLERDGVGFVGNPTLGLGTPRVEDASLDVGAGLTQARIVMNYRTGVFRFSPIDRASR